MSSVCPFISAGHRLKGVNTVELDKDKDMDDLSSQAALLPPPAQHILAAEHSAKYATDATGLALPLGKLLPIV